MKYFAYSTNKPIAKIMMALITKFSKPQPPTHIDPLLGTEIETGWGLVKDDRIRELYWRKDEMGSVVILEANSQAEAEGIVNSLPYAKKGYISFKVIPVGYFEPYEAVYQRLQQKA
jgi:hypothetical protein